VRGSNTTAGGTVTNAMDSASDAAYSGGWNTGNNGGTGFGPWNIQAVAGNSGTFIAEEGWGLWSHEGGHLVEAIRPFNAALGVGQTFSIRMKNGWIWENGGSIGVALRSDTDQVWEIYFNGGDTHYNTPAGESDIAWTNIWLDIVFTLTGVNSYSVDVTPSGGATRTFTGNLTGSINNLRAWSYQNGTGDENNHMRDFYINNMKITAPGEGGSQTYEDFVIVTRQAGEVVRPPIPPITFEAGVGFSFDIPTGYSLLSVEGATEVINQAWNWAPLTQGADYALNNRTITILTTGAADKRMIRIKVSVSP
ncbi:MAG TPA: hypothetical protein P5169_08935, partial [Kiritimatiellia bacterium]|nr:hypothetical protein [Kiritimatiellia bacterium]